MKELVIVIKVVRNRVIVVVDEFRFFFLISEFLGVRFIFFFFLWVLIFLVDVLSKINYSCW